MSAASVELNQLSAAWDIVRDLTEEQRTGRPVELVERIEGVADVNRRIQEISSSSKEIMNSKNQARNPHYDAARVARFRRRLSAGLAARTLVSEECLSDPGQLAYARAARPG
ncbi:hypothetical protein [Nonomuraea roseola]|uniref:Uncharacterized protein n=1 Tax=Nonomuraea roseola TaxID=46179 RepID=A0ABV5PY98_9ACTN